MAACGNGPKTFIVRYDFGSGDEYSCPSNVCSDYGMHCGATLSVRIVDADTLGTDAGPGSDANSSAHVYGELCKTIDASDDLCPVGQVQLTFDNIPTRTMQVQVAIWPPPPKGQEPTCPTGVFDLRGIPIDKSPQPAFGGVAYFEAGKDSVADVMLACREPQLIDEPECFRTNRVTAHLEDMQNLVPVRIEDAPTISVFVGEPHQNTTVEPPEWVLPTTDTYQMMPDTAMPIPAKWFNNDVPAFTQYGCVTVAQELPQPSTAVTCTNDLSLESDGHLDLDGLLLPQTVLDELLSAANIATPPAEGIVVGRVIDAVGAPLAGVTVIPSPDPSIEVLYVDDTRSSVSSIGPTSSDGYFISRNAPFDTVWEATDSDGRVQAGDFRAGLVSGKVSVVVIQMTEP